VLKRRAAGRLRADGRSSVAIEFAIIAPVLVIIVLGIYEICNAAIIYEQVQNAAHSIPASASNLAAEQAPGNLGAQVYTGQTTLTYAQAQLAASEIWAEIPELRSGFQNGSASVTITSVTFIPTLPPTPPAAQTVKPGTVCNPVKNSVYCSYTPTVVWSVAYTGGNSPDGQSNFATPVIRSCTGAPTAGTQKNATVYYATGAAYVTLAGGLNSEAPPSTNTAPGTVPTWVASDLTSLPTYFVANPDPILAAPSPILVVDVHLKYVPVFGLFIKNGLDFYGTGFFPVRSVEAATVTSAGTTALTPSQQFTSIIDDAVNGPNGVIPGPPTSTYCINTGHGLTPYAYSVPAS
jgi:Flp pilus assembly protein TadG